MTWQEKPQPPNARALLPNAHMDPVARVVLLVRCLPVRPYVNNPKGKLARLLTVSRKKVFDSAQREGVVPLLALPLLEVPVNCKPSFLVVESEARRLLPAVTSAALRLVIQQQEGQCHYTSLSDQTG